MIGTLFAQEFRNSRKYLGVTLAVLLLVAVVSFALAALQLPVVGPIMFGLGVLCVAVHVPVTLGVLAEQYWRTMYGKEGYFTMALPVRGRSLYWAKVLYAFAAVLAAILLTVLGIVIAVVSMTLSQGGGLDHAFETLRDGISALGPAMAWFLVISIAVQLVYTVIAGSAVMSIGAQGRFNHLGFGAPVIGAVILYFVMQFVGLAAMLFVPFGIRLTGPDAGSLVPEGMLHGFIAAVRDPVAGSEAPQVLGLGIFVVSILASVLLAWAAVRSIERRTSLR